MVCIKCQKLEKQTELATPAVKKKNELYYGSPASAATNKQSKPAATLGNAGIGKSKLLSKSAKNPYAAYSSACSTCKTKVDQGRTFCHRCAYKSNACARCGKNQNKEKKFDAASIVQGQKFSAK